LWLVAPRAEVAMRRFAAFHQARALRQVLYERTNPSVRSQLHRNVGTTLERDVRQAQPSPRPNSPCISSLAAS
jgi:hypothetical protein